MFDNINLKKYNNIYIYGFGLTGKWLSENLNKKVEAFIDTDEKKSGFQHNSVKVLSVNDAEKILGPNDLIIVTIVDIQDIIYILDKKFSKTQWLPLGPYLKEIDFKNSINNTVEDIDFIKYSAEAVEKCQNAFINNDPLFLRSLDVVISEKCSLKCKDCSNLMQYYLEPRNFSFDQVKNEFEELTKNIRHIFEIRLIGGEPFMNKEIYEIIDYFLDHKKITKLVIYTNGTIPLKKDRIEKYSNSKLVFTITDYGTLSKNTDKVHDLLKELSVTTRRHPPENWTDSAKIFDFKRDEKEMKELFEVCCGKNLLTTMNGKLYRCPFAANAESLSAIPKDKNNSVSISASAEEILNYTRKIKYIPACNFCNGRSFDMKEIVPAIQTKEPITYKKLS